MSNHELYWRLGDSRWVWGHDLKRLYDDEERDVVREVLSRQHWNHSPMDFAVGGDAERLQWANRAIDQDTDPVDVGRRRPDPELPTELPMIVWQAANRLVNRMMHLRRKLGYRGSILAEVNRNDLVAELLRVDPGIDCEAASRTIPRMSRAVGKAGASLEWVRRRRPDLTPANDSRERFSRAEYDCIAEHGCPAYPDDEQGRPTLPKWPTWSRYVREYLRLTEGSVNSSRRGRPTGRSVANREAI